MMKKLFLDTFKGVSGDVSSKRATAFYFVVFLVSSLHIAYIIYIFMYNTLEYFTWVLYGYLGFVALLLGLATIENLTSFVNSIKGYAKTNKIDSSVDNSVGNSDSSTNTSESKD